jgi:hypothetical protein
LEAVNAGVGGITYIMYFMIILMLAPNLLHERRATFVIFALSLCSITISYHTLATYLIILLSSIIVLEIALLAITHFHPTISFNWLFIGLGLIFFVSTYSIFAGAIGGIFTYLNSLSAYNRLNSEFFSYPGITIGNITSHISSFVDIGSELVGVSIVAIMLILGLRNGFRNFQKENAQINYGFLLSMSLFVLGVGLFIALGELNGAGRIYQVSWSIIPIFTVLLFRNLPRKFLKVFAIIVLMGVILTPSYFLFYQPSYGISSNTFAEINYVGQMSPIKASIFTDFVTAESLIHYGTVNVFGLSEFLSPKDFANYSSILYQNGTSMDVRQVVFKVTNGNNVIFVQTRSDLGGVALEDTSYVVSNQSYISTYELSFNLVYSANDVHVFEISP